MFNTSVKQDKAEFAGKLQLKDEAFLNVRVQIVMVWQSLLFATKSVTPSQQSGQGGRCYTEEDGGGVSKTDNFHVIREIQGNKAARDTVLQGCCRWSYVAAQRACLVERKEFPSLTWAGIGFWCWQMLRKRGQKKIRGREREGKGRGTESEGGWEGVNVCHVRCSATLSCCMCCLTATTAVGTGGLMLTVEQEGCTVHVSRFLFCSRSFFTVGRVQHGFSFGAGERKNIFIFFFPFFLYII